MHDETPRSHFRAFAKGKLGCTMMFVSPQIRRRTICGYSPPSRCRGSLTTVARRVCALEQRIGARLFDRLRDQWRGRC